MCHTQAPRKTTHALPNAKSHVTELNTRLDQRDFSTTKVIDSLGRAQESAIVNESGLSAHNQAVDARLAKQR